MAKEKDLIAEPLEWRAIDYRVDVENGTVLAQIDDALPRTAVDQCRLAVDKAIADLAQFEAKATLSAQIRDRNLVLLKQGQGQLAQEDYETSVANARVDAANVRSAQVAVDTAKVNLRQAEINLGYTTIRSPVKGVVVAKQVNVGQTVVSAQTASALFLIAKDLTRMQIWASVNEADVGHVRPGQKVTFTIDTFPNETFPGVVTKVRLDAVMTQNVVTYPVEISFDNRNPDGTPGKLMPYLTANLLIEVDQVTDGLLVPNAALRYRPAAARVHPENREAYDKAQRGRKQAGGDDAGAKQPAAEKVTTNRGMVWVKDGDYLRPVEVRTGLTDGARTEVVQVISGKIDDGTELVVGEEQAAGGDNNVKNPFAIQNPFGQRKKQ
jgi:HlyD family secretion protein